MGNVVTGKMIMELIKAAEKEKKEKEQAEKNKKTD